MAALQERKQALEALLSSRVGELKQVCLQEAVRLAPTPPIPHPLPAATPAAACRVYRHLLGEFSDHGQIL